MRFPDLLSTAFKNLYQRKARTFLTILGVIIGTMSITLMVAVGLGSQQQFMESIAQSEDLTKITVNRNWSNDPNKTGVLDKEAVLYLESLENVVNVIPMKSISIYLENEKYVGEIYAQALPLEKLQSYSEKLAWGKIGKSGKEAKIYLGANQLEYTFRKKKSNKELWEMPVATDIKLEKQDFEMYFGGYYIYQPEFGTPEDLKLPDTVDAVIGGVFMQTGTELDYNAYIDISYLDEMIEEHEDFAEFIGLSEEYEQVYVYATDMNAVEPLLNTIKEAGYECYSPLEWINQMQEESARQQFVWGAVGAISLLVSAIGIANTMLTSIMERRREIGILKVLGCSPLKINLMFLIEAGVIGILGGLLGVLLSYGFVLAARFIPAISQNIYFHITLPLALGAIFGSALIGMVAGIYPAVRATRMSPLAALKNE